MKLNLICIERCSRGFKVDAEGLGCPSTKSLNLVIAHATVFGVLSGSLSEAVESVMLRVEALSAETVAQTLLYTVFCKWLTGEAEKGGVVWLWVCCPEMEECLDRAQRGVDCRDDD